MSPKKTPTAPGSITSRGTDNPTFSASLPFRPPQGAKRKRNEEQSEATDTTKSTAAPTTLPSHEPLAYHPMPKGDDGGNSKRQKGTASENESAVAQNDDPNLALLRKENNIMAPPPSRGTEITPSTSDGTIAQRVARRRREPVDPFIPRRPSRLQMIRDLQRNLRRRPLPVFGKPSLAVMDPAEARLVAALKKPQATIVTDMYDLDNVPENGESTKHARRPERPKRGNYCVCKVEADTNMVPCVDCSKVFHPNCLGKGLQHRHEYRGHDILINIARKCDADHYGASKDFTCRACDFSRMHSPANKGAFLVPLYEESQRRPSVFQTKVETHSGKRPLHICDSCDRRITTTRYECKYCDDLDLCRDCYSDPAVSSKHQHAKSDKILR
ncbi:hypothetical protein WHR41_03538 [Cladosporium halotolerans]|uniref:ZZ-type domain-containing protein n=1 Tax=Cladosporium halotolerans TaxID=1052096 RepID=A0AB34KVI7_9PEZI